MHSRICLYADDIFLFYFYFLITKIPGEDFLCNYLLLRALKQI